MARNRRKNWLYSLDGVELQKIHALTAEVEEVPEALALMRVIAGYTQVQLGQKIDRSIVNQYENSVPKALDNLRRLAEACGFKMHIIFEKEGGPGLDWTPSVIEGDVDDKETEL